MTPSKQTNAARRLVVFGATGHLGRELIERLDESDWPIGELVGVASMGSVGEAIDFRGEVVEVEGTWPVLKGRDLVFICTPQAQALEIVREALRAEVACIDCSGALSAQAGIPMLCVRGGTAEQDEGVETAPLLSLPSSTALSWAPILSAFDEAVAVERVIGTVLCTASAWGRQGVVSLSEESIALFNQSAGPATGPAGQPVAFEVIPGGGVDCDRVRSDLARIFGERLRADVASVQVPAFGGEGASLALELSAPVDRAAFEARLESRDDLVVVRDGIGSRGLVAVEGDADSPVGPTLRDATGAEQVLVGRIEADASLPAGRGWRLWVASDPLRLTADQALRVAGRRLGLA